MIERKSFVERRVFEERRRPSDRRKNRRFKIKSVTYTVFKTMSDEDMGELIDISKGGLSFRYYISSKKVKDPYELNIISADDSFQLNNVPIKEISNITKSDKSHLKSIVQGRFGFQFMDLTPYQISELDYFMKNYTLKT